MLRIEDQRAQSREVELQQIRGFISASEELRFASEDRVQRYAWVERVLIEQQYASQGKVGRGLQRRYIEKMTGLSRAQAREYRRHRFAPRYTLAGIKLLASVDEAYEALSGPSTRAILKREFELYG